MIRDIYNEMVKEGCSFQDLEKVAISVQLMRQAAKARLVRRGIDESTAASQVATLIPETGRRAQREGVRKLRSMYQDTAPSKTLTRPDEKYVQTGGPQHFVSGAQRRKARASQSSGAPYSRTYRTSDLNPFWQ